MLKPWYHSFIKIYRFSAVCKMYLTDILVVYLKSNPFRGRYGKGKENI